MRLYSKETTLDNWTVGLMATAALTAILFPGNGNVLAAPPDSNVEAPARAKVKNPPRRLEGHYGGVLSLAFSPDGKHLVAGGKDDPTVPVWDLTRGKLRYELPSREGDVKTDELPWHEGAVRAVAYSPDGTMIATGCGYQSSKKTELVKILLWNAKSGKLIREIPAHRGGVYALAFSHDGKRLVSGGGEDTGKVWDVASGKEVQQFVLDSRSDRVIAVAFSPDGKTILLVSQKGELVQGDVESGHIARSWLFGGGHLFQVLASGKEFLRLEYDSDVVVRRYSLPGLKGVDTRWRQRGWARGSYIYLAAASPDGKTLALPAPGGIALWSLETGKQLLVLDLDERRSDVNILAFSPDGKTLAAGLASSTSILVWDISRARLDALWAELALGDDKEAEDHVKDLAALPKEALPYVAERLQHLAKLEQQVRTVATRLDDENFEVREKASQQLQALGPEAEFALERVLKNKPSPEVRKRVEELLAAFDKRPPDPGPVDPTKLTKEQFILWRQGKWPLKTPEVPKPSEERALKRAFAALEKIGTAEARQAVKNLAESAPDGLVREEAKASLERLARMKSPAP